MPPNGGPLPALKQDAYNVIQFLSLHLQSKDGSLSNNDVKVMIENAGLWSGSFDELWDHGTIALPPRPTVSTNPKKHGQSSAAAEDWDKRKARAARLEKALDCVNKEIESQRKIVRLKKTADNRVNHDCYTKLSYDGQRYHLRVLYEYFCKLCLRKCCTLPNACYGQFCKATAQGPQPNGRRQSLAQQQGDHMGMW